MTHTAPRHEELQALIARAIIDPGFSNALLNGHRAECLAEFDLTPEEQVAASTAQAGSLKEYAGALDRWIVTERRRLRARALAHFPVGQQIGDLPVAAA